MIARSIAELEKMLDQLPGKLANNVIRGGLRAGAKVVAVEAKALSAGISTPDLKKDGHVVAPGEPIARAIEHVAGVRDGVITGKVRLRGFPASVGIWAEYGTSAHIISIADDARPTAKTRHGIRPISLRTINRNNRAKAAADGEPLSLVINGQFVGQSVNHPGASAHPFMRPAIDAKQAQAVSAVADYVRARLATINGLDKPDPGDAE